MGAEANFGNKLQSFADKNGIAVEISDFPPETSKWYKIEHRMFSQISKNWRERPFETIEIVISLIASTTTETGLNIKYGLDRNIYIKQALRCRMKNWKV